MPFNSVDSRVNIIKYNSHNRSRLDNENCSGLDLEPVIMFECEPYISVEHNIIVYNVFVFNNVVLLAYEHIIFFNDDDE